jgi:hypothetical protein
MIRLLVLRLPRRRLLLACASIAAAPQVQPNVVSVFCYSMLADSRRGVRAVEGARLESVCWGNSTVGSNPTLSANKSLLSR